MKKIIFFGIISAAIFTACESAEEENTTPTSQTNTVAPAITSVPDSQKALVPAPLETTPPPPVMAGASPKLNPAHGQPGHRCEIAVGAPLPAAGTTIAAQPATQTSPAVQNIVPAAPPPPAPVMNMTPVAGTGKGVNPAHGQPGHRCDIAVGAPLN
jgi:hypothetical protein